MPDRRLAAAVLPRQLGHGLAGRVALGNALLLAGVQDSRTAGALRSVLSKSVTGGMTPSRRSGAVWWLSRGVNTRMTKIQRTFGSWRPVDPNSWRTFEAGSDCRSHRGNKFAVHQLKPGLIVRTAEEFWLFGL